jgi:Uma2 family endonuclease
MSVPLHQSNFSYADYLALEASSNVKHEFLGGQIYAMAGGTPEHAALAASAIGLLFAQLRGGNCRTYDSDLRVRTPSGLSTYPDVTVICGPSERHEDDPQAVTNPELIIEVLSRSTEDYDEGDKFEHYKTIASLEQYVLVSHRDRSLELWTREGDSRWRSAIVREGATAELLVGARLDVHELYEAAAEPRA